MNGLFPAPARRLPDYRNGSIVNLMGSLLAGLGGDAAGYAPLAGLPPEEIGAYRQVALIVVDGLGDDFLLRQGPATHLGQRRRARLTSVFPSTTAAAVTSFLTGLAPQEHGLTGWHMYFRELGAVLAVLPGKPRYGGVALSQAGWPVQRFFGHRPIFDRLAVASRVVAPRHIAYSDFNRAHQGRAQLSSFADLDGFFSAMVRALTASQGRQFVYAYWPELDRIAHESGSLSAAATAHFRDWDAAFGRFLAAVAGTDTLVIVTADHGFIDTDDAHTVDLAQHPELADCLVLPLCGEPWAAYCYVKPQRTKAFERYAAEQLGAVAELYPSQDLIERGWFGLGAPHPGLADRVGDYTLVLKDNYQLRQWLPHEQPYRQVGVHGGISAAEMEVPLAIAAV